MHREAETQLMSVQISPVTLPVSQKLLTDGTDFIFYSGKGTEMNVFSLVTCCHPIIAGQSWGK